MSVTTRPVDCALDFLFAAQDTNRTEHAALYRPETPQADSLVELIDALPMPESTRALLALAARRVMELNERENECERDATRLIDMGCRVRVPLNVIAGRLRPLLRVERDPRLEPVVDELLLDPLVGRDVLLAVRVHLKDGPADRLTRVVEARS